LTFCGIIKHITVGKKSNHIVSGQENYKKDGIEDDITPVSLVMY